MASRESTRLRPEGWEKLFRVLEGPYTEQEVKNKKEFSYAPDLTEYEYVDALVNLYLDRKP